MSRTTADDDKVLISLTGVSKRFVLHKDKSVKERLLYFQDRKKARSDFWALKDVSIEVEQGQTVGIIGHNGSGKSTLLKVMGGIIDPSNGSVRRRGRVAALLELGAGFHMDLTGRENVYINAAILGMSTAETDSVFHDILEFSGIGEFIDTQVKFYSSGMYVRLAFGVAVYSDPDLLLVDEVLAVGDEPFQLKCMNKIREFQREGRTIVLVSHSAEQVAEVCTRAVVLDAGEVVHDGDVGEGIRILREGYERDRLHAIEQSSGEHPEEPQRTTPVRVHSVSVELNGKGTSGPIPRDSTLTFSLDVQVLEPVGWIAGFTLQSTLGQTIYFLNTAGLCLDTPRGIGRYVVEFTIKHVNFGLERLTLSAGATTIDGVLLDNLLVAGHLDFKPDSFGGGMIQFDAAGSIVRR